MALFAPGEPLRALERADPEPGHGQVRLRVRACGVCRTDLHVVDGDLAAHRSPIIPGHEIVGVVDRIGAGVTSVREGDRLGVPWLGHTCGRCRYCLSGQENLCDHPAFTGWTIDGGFADTCVADARYCFPLPTSYSDEDAAPLLCAGLIGFRAWRAAGAPGAIRRIGLYGFGAAAHLVVQVARAQGQSVYGFVRPGDAAAAQFALQMGCVWAGASHQLPPELLDAAILFAPVGGLAPQALKAVRKGGSVICAGIYMSDIPTFSYSLLWEERRIQSIANLTRQDGRDFLALAGEIGIVTRPVTYPLAKANEALADLRAGRFSGAAVLRPG